MTDVLLQVRGLHAWYGESHVLQGMDFEIRQGEVVSLLGRNGVGKTTTVKSIMGLVSRRAGSILLRGRELVHEPPERIARLGIALCPEERAIFSSLTVRENLLLPPVVAPRGMRLDEIFELFPNLAHRGSARGTSLSGGEQQMLAIARILRTGASLLLLDEPSEGLAPVIVEQIGHAIGRLRARGMSMLLVEQNLGFARRVADRHCIVEGGAVIETLSRDALARQSARVGAALGV